MRRLAPLTLLVLLAACGGGGDTVGPGTSPQPSVVKPVHATLDRGTVELRRASNTRTSVSLTLRSLPRGLTAELDRGSCGAKAGLQRLVALGKVAARTQSWSVTQPLPQLTTLPLAFVLRRSGGTVADCGNVPLR